MNKKLMKDLQQHIKPQLCQVSVKKGKSSKGTTPKIPNASSKLDTKELFCFQCGNHDLNHMCTDKKPLEILLKEGTFPIRMQC